MTKTDEISKPADVAGRLDGVVSRLRALSRYEHSDFSIGDEAADRITELEDLLFAKGQMMDAPCFCCGYNGPGYYQPATHPCAKRHHESYTDG